jgi:hypothetical protein
MMGGLLLWLPSEPGLLSAGLDSTLGRDAGLGFGILAGGGPGRLG